jgi:hypothetical protein
MGIYFFSILPLPYVEVKCMGLHLYSPVSFYNVATIGLILIMCAYKCLSLTNISNQESDKVHEITDSHVGESEDDSLLGYCTMFITFQRCVLPVSLRQSPLKCQSTSVELHGTTSQKIVIFR